mgnify:CR=1 FL=1
MKKFLSIILCLALAMSFSVTAFAAEPSSVSEPTVTAVEPRLISGYGHIAGLKNTAGYFTVDVTKTSGDGYGLTLKTYGSGTVYITVQKPDNSLVYFGGNWGNTIEMNNQDEVQFNLKGAQGETWKVHYHVMGGYLDIHCHIYG